MYPPWPCGRRRSSAALCVVPESVVSPLNEMRSPDVASSGYTRDGRVRRNDEYGLRSLPICLTFRWSLVYGVASRNLRFSLRAR